ncbi:MAG: hypothetical protein GY950_34420, partial [bacterium]|nr:hypothetical protein [bacterium]
MTLNNEHAGAIVKRHQKIIKSTIKKKIKLYAPLEFKPVFRLFMKQFKENHCDVENVEEHLNRIIKDFLVENAYFALEEKYIQRLLMNKLGTSDPNDIRLLDIGDAVREKLEKNGLKRLKGFKEKATFKTFLTTAVIRLLYDSWRQKRSIGENVTKYGPEFDALFDPPVGDPFNRLLQLEDDHIKQKAAAFLPQVLAKLDDKEKLVIQLKYEKNMKISAIARTLERTRFKT